MSKIKINKTLVKFNNITKKFGDLIANDSIDFYIKENEVHALLGENGAGKSTLMSILFGLYKPTSGSIEINGSIETIKSPKHANDLKIAMLPQHFKLIENMTVLQNVMLGYEIVKNGFINKKAAIEKIEIVMKKYKINLDLKSIVGNLSVSDKQKVELLKILWGDANILIFDEPTSILTPVEVQQFLKLINNLKKAGKTILLITHKLPEIKAVADRVSIIRKGKYIDTLTVSKTTERKMANMMVGKEIDLNLSNIKRLKTNSEITVLEVDKLSYNPNGFEKEIEDVSFEVKSGEILGIAAIDGNGQSELMELIAGLKKPTSGTVKIAEHDVTRKSPKAHYYTKENYTETDSLLRVKKIHEKFLSSHDNKVRNLTKYNKEKQMKITNDAALDYREMYFLWRKKSSLLSHIPEDRQSHGIILDYSVAKNAVLQDLKYFSNPFGIVSAKQMKNRINFLEEKYDIRGIGSIKTKARVLSGGNQQKLILGREIERGSNVLLAVNPTRGLDVGAIRNVYTNIIRTRNDGTAVLLSSGELDEIMQVSDRIIVMYEGKIVNVSKRNELTKLQLGTLISTGKLNNKKVVK